MRYSDQDIRLSAVNVAALRNAAAVQLGQVKGLHEPGQTLSQQTQSTGSIPETATTLLIDEAWSRPYAEVLSLLLRVERAENCA